MQKISYQEEAKQTKKQIKSLTKNLSTLQTKFVDSELERASFLKQLEAQNDKVDLLEAEKKNLLDTNCSAITSQQLEVKTLSAQLEQVFSAA